MIIKTHPLPVNRQAELLTISRSNVYYLPAPTPERDAAPSRHRARRPRLGDGHHVFADATWLHLPGGGHGLGDAAGAGVAGVAHADGRFLYLKPSRKPLPVTANQRSSTPIGARNSRVTPYWSRVRSPPPQTQRRPRPLEAKASLGFHVFLKIAYLVSSGLFSSLVGHNLVTRSGVDIGQLVTQFPRLGSSRRGVRLRAIP